MEPALFIIPLAQKWLPAGFATLLEAFAPRAFAVHILQLPIPPNLFGWRLILVGQNEVDCPVIPQNGAPPSGLMKIALGELPIFERVK
jgi:hypothetical protein